VGQEKQISNMN